MVGMDVEDRLLQIPQKPGIRPACGRPQSLPLHAQLSRRQLDLVELTRIFQERPISPFPHIGYDLAHRVGEFIRRRYLSFIQPREEFGFIFFTKDANHSNTLLKFIL